jgi:hypothetical protein
LGKFESLSIATRELVELLEEFRLSFVVVVVVVVVVCCCYKLVVYS